MRLSTLLPMAMWLGGSAQPPLSVSDAQKVIETIVDYRLTALEDRTPINFCGEPGFWGTTGEFLGTREQRRFALFTRRAECQRDDAPRTRTVTIDHMRVRGDSVVVASTTVRGTTRILEEYVLLRRDDRRLWPAEYRIRAISVP